MRHFARAAAFILVIPLLILALAACGSPESTPTAEPTIETAPTVIIGPSPESSPAATPTASEASPIAEASPSASDTAAASELFQDFPDYPGSKKEDPARLQSLAPFDQGDYSKVEWQAYLTGDPVDRVRHFYKTELPKRGWQETIWMPTSNDGAEDIAWCIYLKNDNQSAAGVLIGHDQGRTYIVVMRGEGKN